MTRTNFLLCLVLNLCAGLSFAQTSITKVETTPTVAEKLNWTTEGLLSTASNSPSTTFGPSLLYSLDEHEQIGIRVLAPLTNGGNGTTSIMALYRYVFTEKRTSLFAECTFGENWFNYDTESASTFAPSLGTNIGVRHRLTQDIMFGGLAGLEWGQTNVERDFAYNTENKIIGYARIGLFGALVF